MLVRFCSCFFLASSFLVFAAGLAAAQTQVVQHPLQALTSQEYWAVYDVLRDNGKIDADTFVPSVLLHEPPKDRVLAWKPGDPVFREADAILNKQGVVTEARVDIPGRKLLLFKERPDVQGPFFDSEFLELAEAINKDTRVIEALKKRGITDMNTVKCESACRSDTSHSPSWRATASCTATAVTCTASFLPGAARSRDCT